MSLTANLEVRTHVLLCSYTNEELSPTLLIV